MRLKYEPIFFAHFANYVNELIYDNIYTEYRVSTKDLLDWNNDTERMGAYALMEKVQQEQLIAFNAQLFDSPLRVTTEMPLMILTDTRGVFMRRKKRLRKLISNQSSQSHNSSSSLSPSYNFSASTVVILKESLTNLSFMNLESSFSSYYSSSAANIYSRPSSMLKEEDSVGTLQPWEHFMVKDRVENELKHLILEFHSKQSSDTVESVQSRKEYLQEFAQKIKEISHHQFKVSQRSSRTQQIESVVKAQLKRYKIGQVIDLSCLNSSSRASKTKKRVRDKAQELLRSIRSGSTIQLSRE